jgi:DNA polymerase III gamma/tau subunit
MADGGFRDGVKILEELSFFANGAKITKVSVEKSYKATTILLQVANLLVALKEYKAKEGIEVIKELLDDGVDLKFFITQMLADLHKKLLNEMKVETQNNVPANLKFNVNEIKMLVEFLSRAYQEMKYAVLPQLPLELAIIEWCSSKQNFEQAQDHAESFDKLRTELSKADPDNSQVQKQVVQVSSASVSDLRKQVGTMKKIKALYGTTSAKQNSKNEEISITTTSVELMQTNGNGPVTQDWMDLFWKNFISEMKKYNHTVAGVLRGCVIKSYSDQKLVIQASYKFHKERLDDRKNKDALLKISKLLTGKDVEITVELKKSV